MTSIPAEIINKRSVIAKRFLKGEGIEIGALHHPLKLPANASVKYVDRLSNSELRIHYPELSNCDIVEVDIIDDGEKLSTIQSDSLDFIVANHMLEHCENPIGTIRHHLKHIKRNGIIYYAVPDKIHSFDNKRKLTPFEHLIHDDQNGDGIESREKHYEEWVKYLCDIEDAGEAFETKKKLMFMNYSIHFHVWNYNGFQEFIESTNKYLNEPFDVLLFESNDTEIITVLKKK